MAISNVSIKSDGTVNGTVVIVDGIAMTGVTGIEIGKISSGDDFVFAKITVMAAIEVTPSSYEIIEG